MPSGTGSRPDWFALLGVWDARGQRGQPTAPSPVPGGWRRAPNRPATRWPARSGSLAGCGRCPSPRRRSCRETWVSRRCGSWSTSRGPPRRVRGGRGVPGRAGADRARRPGPDRVGPVARLRRHRRRGRTRRVRDYAERSLHVSPLLDGAWRTDGHLTAEAGEILRNALDRRARARSTAPRRPKPTPTAPRSRAPPRNAATTPSSSYSSAPPPPATRAPASTSPPSPPSSTSPSSPRHAGEIVGETEAGTPVSGSHRAAVLLRLLGISRRPPPTPTSTPVDLGHTARLASSPRSAACWPPATRGRTFPGCDKPPRLDQHPPHQPLDPRRHSPTTGNQTLPSATSTTTASTKAATGLRRLPQRGELEFTRPDGTPITVPKGKAKPTPPARLQRRRLTGHAAPRVRRSANMGRDEPLPRRLGRRAAPRAVRPRRAWLRARAHRWLGGPRWRHPRGGHRGPGRSATPIPCPATPSSASPRCRSPSPPWRP